MIKGQLFVMILGWPCDKNVRNFDRNSLLENRFIQMRGQQYRQHFSQNLEVLCRDMAYIVFSAFSLQEERKNAPMSLIMSVVDIEKKVTNLATLLYKCDI